MSTIFNLDQRDYQPSRSSSKHTVERRQTRSATRAANARNRAMSLGPRITTDQSSSPVTPLLTPPHMHLRSQSQNPSDRPNSSKRGVMMNRCITTDSHATVDGHVALSPPIPVTFPGPSKASASPPPTSLLLPAENTRTEIAAKIEALSERLQILPPHKPSKIYPTLVDTWIQSVNRLIELHEKIKTSTEEKGLEAECTFKRVDEQVVTKVIKAREKAMTCPISGALTDTMYIVSPCGHAFSEAALHDYFKFQVLGEIGRLRPFYRHITDELLAKQPIDRGFLLDLCARTRLFKPKYQCGYCRKNMVTAPVKCGAFGTFGATIRELTKGVNDDDTSSFACDIADYFLFFAHNPFK